MTESSRVRIPEGRHFCLFALQAVLPLLPAKMRRLPDEDWLERDSLVCCPDPEERVVMRVERIGERTLRTEDLTQVPTGELGVGLLTDQQPNVYEAVARRLDAAGVDCLSVFHDLRYQPAIGPLLLGARVTERIRLGPAALNPFTLHPYEIAGQAAMLDLASEGRSYLGLAKGAWLELLGLRATSSLTALREAVEVVTKLLAGDESGVCGERFRLEPGVTLAYERVRERIPLLIGTWGPRTVAWAGTVADEVKIGGSANPELIPLVRDWLGDSPTRIVVGCVTVVDEDAAWARERARAAVTGYLDVVATLDPTLQLREGVSAPLEKFTIAGTPEQVADRVRALWAAGAHRVELGTPQGRTTPEGIDLICDRVLPLLRC